MKAMDGFYHATLFQTDVILAPCCGLNVECPLQACVLKNLPPQLEMLFEKVLELPGSRASLQEAGDWGVGIEAPLPVYSLLGDAVTM